MKDVRSRRLGVVGAAGVRAGPDFLDGGDDIDAVGESSIVGLEMVVLGKDDSVGFENIIRNCDPGLLGSAYCDLHYAG